MRVQRKQRFGRRAGRRVGEMSRGALRKMIASVVRDAIGQGRRRPRRATQGKGTIEVTAMEKAAALAAARRIGFTVHPPKQSQVRR